MDLEVGWKHYFPYLPICFLLPGEYSLHSSDEWKRLLHRHAGCKKKKKNTRLVLLKNKKRNNLVQ